MPRDEDEDVEDARPFPRGTPRVPTGRPADDAPPALTWGVCGVVDTAGTLTTAPGESGVIRLVTSGVGYTAPPLPTAWRTMPAEVGRYEMIWPGDPGDARTLRSLRADLERAARGGLFVNQDHPLLTELNEAAAALADAADRLHRAGWSVGLLQPANVVLRGQEGAREAVLVDLGFTWRGSFGPPPWEDSPGRPAWLDPATPFRWLWDHDPARQQFADPKNGLFRPPDPTADIRVLGRLLAWLLSGQTSPSPPAVGGPGGPPPAWAVVADAANGRIESAAALADRLRDAPPSDYFAPLPLADDSIEPVRSSGGGKTGLVVLSVVLLAAAGVGGWWFLNRQDRDKTTDKGTGVTEPSARTTQPTGPTPTGKKADPSKKKGDPAAFAKLIAAFDARTDVRGLLAALAGLYETAPSEKKPEVDSRRKAAFEKWQAEVTKAVTEGADPSRRTDVTERLNGLVGELRRLTETSPAPDPGQQMEEEKWLADVSILARQFGERP